MRFWSVLSLQANSRLHLVAGTTNWGSAASGDSKAGTGLLGAERPAGTDQDLSKARGLPGTSLLSQLGFSCHSGAHPVGEVVEAAQSRGSVRPFVATGPREDAGKSSGGLWGQGLCSMTWGRSLRLHVCGTMSLCLRGGETRSFLHSPLIPAGHSAGRCVELQERPAEEDGEKLTVGTKKPSRKRQSSVPGGQGTLREET